MEQISFIECFKAPFDILALYMVLIFNLALTLVHFVKELKGFQWRISVPLPAFKFRINLASYRFSFSPWGL